ncbi:2-hydroxymuconate tautomerase [Aminivibrio sp.]|uniref:2-hydroxymuconate tautomerase n=1 Tax=Aminivibrio sp. TaxID=1872489 RepID=UPI00345E9F31
MPIINIHLFEGRTVDQKRKLAAEVTDAVCRSLNVTPDVVRIIMSEMAGENYSIAGVLKSDQQGK